MAIPITMKTYMPALVRGDSGIVSPSNRTVAGQRVFPDTDAESAAECQPGTIARRRHGISPRRHHSTSLLAYCKLNRVPLACQAAELFFSLANAVLPLGAATCYAALPAGYVLNSTLSKSQAGSMTHSRALRVSMMMSRHTTPVSSPVSCEFRVHQWSSCYAQTHDARNTGNITLRNAFIDDLQVPEKHGPPCRSESSL
jgi:hypothetical protein